MTRIDQRHAMAVAAPFALIAAGCWTTGGGTIATGGASGTSTTTTTGVGGEGGHGGSTTTDTNFTTTTTSSTTTTTTVCTAACCPDASCAAIDKECLGLVDNAGKSKFGLRMSELHVSAPSAFATGIVAGIVAGAVTPANPGCYLVGSGTFNWLLQFDLTLGKLQTGGAKPVAAPTMGYSFLNQTVAGVPIHPVTYDAVVNASGSFTVATGKDIVMPIFLDAAGAQYVLLPLRAARFTMGKLSPSHGCIGHFNAQGLDVNNACLPDGQHSSFVTGAEVDAVIVLEDADSVVISSLQETLCVLLASNQGVAGPNGYKVCARNASGKITFQGDACSTGAGCGDAMTFSADFAASSVDIH